MSDIHHLMMMMTTVCGPACDVSDPSLDPQVGHVLSYASPMPLWHYHIHVPPEPISFASHPLGLEVYGSLNHDH